MKILVINAGSSSLKFQLIDMDDESVKAKGLVERIGIEGTHFKQTVLGTDKVIEFTRNMKDHTEAISAVLTALTDKDNGAIASLDEIGACGHRVLHGGETFKESVLVTEESMKGIEELVPLGPLHQPANIAGIKACQAVMPNKPNVAVFDTAFHQTMPKKAFLYGVPYEYYTDLKVRRYGFHGTSHRFIAGETPKYLGKKPEDCKFIICHLGNGSSLREIVGMDEGLEYRFLRAAQTAASREELIAAIKSKRYTHARLSRLCAHILLGVSRDFAAAHRAPTYARVLGFRKDAAPLLRAIKAHASIPLVTKAAAFDRADPLFSLDIRAQDLWSLGVSNPALRACGRDFTTSPIILP